MERRKFVIGLGALAAGGAAAAGSGAFDSVEAEREVTVEFEGDSAAYLGITGDETFVEDDTADSRLTIDIGGGDGTAAGGEGLNEYAETTISDIVQLTNQGTQEVGLSLDESDVDDNVQFFFSDSAAEDAEQLEPGEYAWLGVVVDDTDGDLSSGDGDVGTLTVSAGVEEEGPEPEPEPEPPAEEPGSLSGEINGDEATEAQWTDYFIDNGEVTIAESDETVDVSTVDTGDYPIVAEFEVDEIEPGEYTLEASVSGDGLIGDPFQGETELEGEETITVEPGEETDGIEIVLEEV